MNRSLAKALSVVLHPLLLPTYLFAIILYYMPESTLTLPFQVRWVVMALIFFTTCIIPGLAAYSMVRLGHLDSVEMDKREQRGLPLLFTGACYMVTAYLLYNENAFDALFYFVMGVIAASVLLTYLVSLFWKISAHGMGMGGALGLLLVLNWLAPEANMLFPIATTLLLSGAVLTARLALNAHTPAQVYAGLCSGLLLAVSAAYAGL